IVDRERHRMEWQILDALRTSVSEMRTVALTTADLDLDALKRLRGLAQTTIEDLRSLLVTLRTAPAPEPENTLRQPPRWRTEVAISLAVIVLAAVDGVLVGRLIPDLS